MREIDTIAAEQIHESGLKAIDSRISENISHTLMLAGDMTSSAVSHGD